MTNKEYVNIATQINNYVAEASRALRKCKQLMEEKNMNYGTDMADDLDKAKAIIKTLYVSTDPKDYPN